MKRLILLTAIALTMTGCAVYPDYYGYYDSGYPGYYGYPYGYAGTSVNLNFRGGYYDHGWYGHRWYGNGWHGHGGHGRVWHR